MTGKTATGGSVRGRSKIKFGGSTTGWAPRIVLLTALAAGLLLAAGSATADPGIQSKRAQAQAIIAELEQLDMSLAVSIESYNYANVELDRIDGELETNARHLVAARKSLNVAHRRIAERLRDLYVNGDGDSTLEVLLGSQSLDDIVARLDAIQRVSSQDTQILAEVKQFRREVETRRANLKDARVEQTQVVAERAAQRQSIESRLAERQQLLSSVKDEIEQMRAEEARRQAALEAQARARLEAQRLAAQQALDAQDQVTYTAPAADVATPAVDLGETSLPSAPPPDGTQASQVIAIAMQYLGVPYVWGGASPSTGFDCSGLTSYAYAQIGISLPHHAASQYGLGIPVSYEDLQPADLVFFHGLGHMGMYIGGDQFIHAPHTGDVVKISTLSSYSGYVGARRIL
ncbi:MAG: NlpC/P60 family protein [Actinomycetota bacterium]|nr:NlpC/P60 family protein [Actinomycetota bacterium]